MVDEDLSFAFKNPPSNHSSSTLMYFTAVLHSVVVFPMAACGIVEIDQWMPIDGLFQNGEVMPEMLHESRVSLAQGARIEEGGFAYIKPS